MKYVASLSNNEREKGWFEVNLQFSSENGVPGTRKGVSQSYSLAHGDIEVFAPARGSGSLFPIAY